jgi:hypothetical protein
VNIRKVPRVLAVVLSLGLFLVAALSTRTASAQDAKVEATAKALQKKAMDEDYLATEFAKGQDKLEKAIVACGADKCSVALRALLRRDLGVMQVGGQLDKEKGITNFVEALKLDPATALDPDLRTKDLDAAFAEAKKRAGGGAAARPTPAAPGKQPTGDFVHEPVPEQQVRTAIPVYAEYSGDETLMKVIVRYRGSRMGDWKPVELKKSGEKGWAGVLPCDDVQPGTTHYYIQGYNAENDAVAVGGARNDPYKVKVITEKVADPPHLPGEPPPTQCAYSSRDCPPDFPGCHTPEGPPGPGGPAGKAGGEFCEEDTECKSKECKANKCTEPKGPEKQRKIWIGVSAGFEFQFVPSADRVCTLNPPNVPNPLVPVNTNNYYCTTSDGSDYPYRPVSTSDSNPRASENSNLRNDVNNSVGGGGALGNVRLMLSADYAINMNLLLGLRLGYVLRTYPGDAAGVDGKSFPPIHVEVRGTYLFGKDALAQTLAPYAMAGAGVSTFEAPVKVTVVETTTTGDVSKEVDAWHLAGPGFVTVGGGVRVGFSARAALMAGLRVNFAFGHDFAPSLGPELGVAFGF